MRIDDSEYTGALASPSWSHCEGLIKAFELAWQAGPTPAIADFLRGEGRSRRALLIELMHVDLEFRYKSAAPLNVEQYFRAFPELASDRHAALGVISAEFDLLRRNGVEVSARDYCRRFPDLEPELAVLLADSAAEESRATVRGGHATLAEPVRQPSIPGYEILEQIGRGGMGLVYKAHETGLGRPVAVKVLPAEYARDPERLERFAREARTTSMLNHPHICTVHALGEHQGCTYIVMELIEGETLRSLLSRRPGWQEIARLFLQAARALAAAHQAGVVHRDIKPENIMVRPDGYAKVLDFGLARRLPRLGVPESGWDTDPGALLGTVGYMSPEQAHGLAVEAPSDIFSLGIVLYQIATGRHPFERSTNLATLNAVAYEEPPLPSRSTPDIPPAFEGLIGAMLHKQARLRPTAAEVEAVLTNLGSAQAASRPVPLARAIVPREPELAKLRHAFAQAEAGAGTFVCILGEPGIGKTTLVEESLASLVRRGSLVGRGNCSERRANTEAYLPIFDALEDLLRKDSSGSMHRLMQAVAPTWFAQLTHTESPIVAPRAASRHAMLREFRTFTQEASRLGTLVLFLDDVHWADVPTVDLLAHVGQHLRGVRLLILATCRSTELLLGPHPFHTVRQELASKGVCIDIPVGFLRRHDVDRYLELTYPNHQFGPAFADLIYARTEGSPLFMVDLLRYLHEHGIIAEANGRWVLARETPDLQYEVPASVRSVIQHMMQRLSDADHRLLSAASVQGLQFDSATLAAVLELPQADVEEQLQRLERIHGLVRRVRDYEFPDGTPSLRYAFVHILYQQALEIDLQPARRAAWSLAFARTLEARHAHDTEAAAELGCLYEAGRDLVAAARQFGCAADNAARVFAHKEAIALAKRGLRLLTKVPASATQRTALELHLQTTLGLQLQVTRGFADHEARQAYSRARQLCAEDADAATSFPVLWGLWLHSKVRSELSRAQEMAEELSALAQRQSDSNLALQAAQALGITAFCRGAPTAALHHVEQASVLYDPKRHGTHAHTFGQDPGVICKAFGAVVLWILGYPDQAVQQSDAAIAMSREHSPSSRAIAQHFAAMLRQLRGEAKTALHHAQTSSAIAAEHELSFWKAGAAIFEGWALAVVDDTEKGLALLRRGLHGWLATDSVTYHTYYLGLLADVLGRRKQIHEALRILREALALVDQTGEGLFEPELYRMRGEMLLLLPQHSSADKDKALEFLRKALTLARRQQARSYELRAATSLVNFEQRFGVALNACSDLETAFRSFQEGFETAHLCEARQLLGL